MRVYAAMDPRLPLSQVGAYARRVEQLGFDGLHVAETVTDGLVTSALALEHTTRLVVRTAVIVAFARSPMLVASTAWGLAASSEGRFQPGLGTQVRGNIEGRFSVGWAEPVARMREYVGSLRAIFEAFQNGAPLRFEGEHYRFTRLQPAFNPGPHDHPAIPIFLGGVNENMCRLAGEVADGLITHPTSSHPRYLEDVCVPNLRAGAAHVSRSDPIELIVSGPVITGATAEAMTEAREQQRRSLALVYSTPAYGKALEMLGFADVGARLHELARDERWEEMPAAVGDELLDVLVPQATYDRLPAVLQEWYGTTATGIVLRPPEDAAFDPQFSAMLATSRAV